MQLLVCTFIFAMTSFWKTIAVEPILERWKEIQATLRNVVHLDIVRFREIRCQSFLKFEELELFLVRLLVS